MNNKLVFQSGHDVATDVRCYSCGKRFADSAKEQQKTSGFVVCSCGGRGAYIQYL